MREASIQPHRITKPIQLVAVWMAGLVLLVGALLGGARFVTSPSWAPGVLVVAAVAVILVGLVLIFLMQTKFRPELQEDAYYSEWLKREEDLFIDFAPENLERVRSGVAPQILATAELEAQRIQLYQECRGVFLVHSWRPSSTPGQVADIVIRLQQHGEGPLSNGLISRVEYALGPKFFDAPVIKTNAAESFRLEVSAYGTMLCLARVSLADGNSFVLGRYIDFDVPPNLAMEQAALRRERRRGSSRGRSAA